MKLYPFQEQAVSQSLIFLYKHGAVYNACEIGLGKCAQAIACAKALNAKDILVICPASVKFVWQKERIKWEMPFAFDVFSYGQIIQESTLAALTAQNWDLLILDEAHFVKSPKAKRTKAILNKLWPKCKYKVCLSGTPMTQSVADCWTLFAKIMPEFGTYWEFAHRYTNVKRTPWGDKPTGIKRADELKQLIRDNFFVRYLKSEVLTDLPAKTWCKIPLSSEFSVKLNPLETKEHERYVEQLKQFFITGKRPRIQPPKSLPTWRREQGLKKIPKILEFCKEVLDQDIPIVVFTYHKEVLKLLFEGLKEYEPVKIEGETVQSEREKAVANFQEGKTNCFIGQINAAGTGITLTRSSTVIFAELDWSPASISQAVDRVHRITQESPVTAYYFSVDGSIDEDLMDTLVDKLETFIEVIN